MRLLRNHRWFLATPLAALAMLATTISPAAAEPLSNCTANLTIMTTSTGVERQAGPVELFTNSGVGGGYTSGFLAGYTISGAQDIVMNTETHKSVLTGQFVARGAGGTLTVHYVGRADLNTGAATGHFVAGSGTGSFTNFVWEGSITAQLVSLTPPTFHATDSGTCFPPR